jgi:uncharacterized protein involved in exopolysaccharide biosynthesis
MRIPAGVWRQAVAAWRHRWLALGIGWLVCLAGWTAVSLMPEHYESGARIQADTEAVRDLLLRGTAADNTPAGQVDTLRRTLLARPALDQVIQRTRLDQRATTPAARDLLAQQLARDIHVTAQSRNIFAIDYRDRDAVLARDVVQGALTVFLDSVAEAGRQQLAATREAAARQLATQDAQLREAERRRAEFQARYTDLLPSDALGGSSRLEAARTRLQQAQGELQDVRMRRDLTQQQIDAAPRPAPEARSGAPRGAIRGNPMQEELKVRLADIDSQIASLERQERAGRADVDRLSAAARGEPEVQAQYRTLDRDLAAARKAHEEQLARNAAIEAAAARAAAEGPRVVVVDAPVVPAEPASPDRPLLLSAVLLAGLGAGLGAALLRVRLDRAFYTLHDLRKLGLPVLGSVSALNPAPRLWPALRFACGLATIFVAFGIVLSGTPGQLLARLLA